MVTVKNELEAKRYFGLPDDAPVTVIEPLAAPEYHVEVAVVKTA